MRITRGCTPEAFERRVPYVFVAAWLLCGLPVVAGAVAFRGLPDDLGPAAVQLGRYLAAGLVAGFCVAGVVVSLLSVAYYIGRRATASRPPHGEQSVQPPAEARDEVRLRVLYLGLLLAAAAALGIDCRVAQWCLADHCPAALQVALEVCALFGEFLAVLAVAATIFLFDVRHRRGLWLVVSCALLAGLAANGAKFLLARTRPRAFDFRGGVAATFVGSLPTISRQQSFPSGHTATATGLALALMVLYPRGRRWLVIPPVLVACQRIECGAHFPSDVLCGAAIGCLAVGSCLRLARSWPWFGLAPALTRSERG